MAHGQCMSYGIGYEGIGRSIGIGLASQRKLGRV